MLSTSIPIGPPPKQSSVRNFPNEKSPAMRPLVKILLTPVYDIQWTFCLYTTLCSHFLLHRLLILWMSNANRHVLKLNQVKSGLFLVATNQNLSFLSRKMWSD